MSAAGTSCQAWRSDFIFVYRWPDRTVISASQTLKPRLYSRHSGFGHVIVDQVTL